ncbi:unnamed protein product [Lactuca virosa]|uniref:Uncharacterized protein n=1 Tax=Lactuca virosa TaxID=75947 RepID=A0AAU9N7E9_9ASTR|nr:unnamed protein product [Lactuca virosa]
MSVVTSEVDYCMLKRYTHEYHISHVLGFEVSSSSSSVLNAPPGGCPSCVLYEEELDEACRFIVGAEKIISVVLGRDLKFFDGLLTLRYGFLAEEVNLRVAEGMKLASDEMMVKAREM